MGAEKEVLTEMEPGERRDRKGELSRKKPR